MKFILLFLSICYCLNSKAYLTTFENRQVIEELNNICGDAWCESSVDFIFSDLSCSMELKTCHLKFSTQDNVTPQQPMVQAQCLLENLGSKFEIFKIDTFSSGTYQAVVLNDNFLNQVDACIKTFIK